MNLPKKSQIKEKQTTISKLQSRRVQAKNKALEELGKNRYWIQNFPYGETLLKYYPQSLENLILLSKRKGRPLSYQEWDRYAYENDFLSHFSLEYITQKKWKTIKKCVAKIAQEEEQL